VEQAELNFVQDGVPPHFELRVRASHDMYLPSSWNECPGLIKWPTCASFWWEWTKEEFYRSK